MSAPLILVVGAGSAGRRHATNLVSLGARVSCFDPRSDRLEQAQDEISGLVAAHEDWDEALESDADGAVIASPPSAHVEQAIACLEGGRPVLLEKPVSQDLRSADQLRQVVRRSKRALLLGYTYRWWPRSWSCDAGSRRRRSVPCATLAS